MPSQSNGLRFDIYERVHLPDEVAAIDELDEIELVPRIGIVQQDEQVLLKGHLLLTGVYRSEEQPLAEQSLEHWIPVEITLPLNRIHRLDDISVEIDNFDVDVLSTRTLNITGVLSLFGIEIDQPGPQSDWQREEPYTVVHSRGDEGPPSEAPPFFAVQPQEQQPFFPQQPSQEQPFFATPPQEQPPFWQAERPREAEEQDAQRALAAQAEAEEAREALARAANARERELLAFAQQETARQEAARQEESRQEAARQEAALEESARQEAARQEAVRQEAVRQEAARQEAAQQEAAREEAAAQPAREETVPAAQDDAFQDVERQDISQPDAFVPQAEAQAPAAEAAVPDSASADQPELEPSARQPSFGEVSVPEAETERKQLRVALAGKPAEDEAAQQGAGNVSFRSLLQSSRREQEAKAAAEQLAEREAVQSRRTSGDEIEWKNLLRPNEEHAFRKMRICIVQREETLDTIAGRYQMQARELALYNRLGDQSVSEGQVLYIP
ncbi:LysM peptidoglycan-binding domain-containing protein [Paenibacillus lycopersici]|uniref:LysM peptidoglycan-binding domain-containing protein n=1 Tax=Paenibacillus lycopersici TaxID=2704462 RepID=A0A6C0G2C7_9BACL|nr:LysM peptidoglycan-binding domain-containing protein [Paenibacillus lycopersici]QHT62083.1 LysM peptidoglycan-binding domain-containing protein [Paenibacillus lycopersici]